MQIHEKIYGDFEITEPILIELINCPTVQRLKNISQQGTPQEYFHRKIFSRFDHSLGVMLLLRKLGANIHCQIAGLLHDISHTAFSHVIDWVIGDPSTESYQDSIYLDFIKKTEIPAILIRNNISLDEISNLESFTLLERDAPSLCADRIDYTLRELMNLESEEVVKNIVADFGSKDGQIFFHTEKTAEKFGNYYAKLQREYWGGNEAKARYLILSDALKLALENKYIALDDFTTTDDEVLKKLIKAGDKKIDESLNKLRNGFQIIITAENQGSRLRKKFRYIDPEILVENEIKKLSEISSLYNQLLKIEMAEAKTDVFIKII